MGGNGLVEMGTFLAILLGTIAGGIVSDLGDSAAYAISLGIILLAVLGYLTSRSIPPAEPVAPDLVINWNPATETIRILRHAYGNKTVFNSILGISWFWFFGFTFLNQLPAYTKNILLGDESVLTFVLTLFALGVGLGSLLCERMSGKIIELGLVPFGSQGRLTWVEEKFDYGRECGVSAGCLYGLKKTIFDSKDFASVVISTYAAAS